MKQYKVTERVSIFVFFVVLLGVGLLGSISNFTNNIWMGYLISGLALFICYDWKEVKGETQ